MKKIMIGLDVGGTHIDGVVLKEGKILKYLKLAYEKETMIQKIHQLIHNLTDSIHENIDTIHLSTTVSTNSISEETGEKTSLILEPGPGMVYDFSHLDADIFSIDSYVNHQGDVIKPINEKSLHQLREHLNTKTLAVIGKFSTRNQNHERFVSDYFKDHFEFITEGHTLSGKLNYPRRVETAYLNNYVYHAFLPFAKEILKQFSNVHILKADGGTMPLQKAIHQPVETIMSGPAASFMGMKALMDQKGDGILLDIGGTTTDIFFVLDGEPLFEPKGIQIGKHKTLVRSIYSHSLPLGGDSSIRYHDGHLEFGKRKGFAIGFGGNHLTVTDALIVLEAMHAEDVQASQEHLQKLNPEKEVKEIAQEIVTQFVSEIKEQVDETLFKINQKPVYTIQEVLENRQLKPKFIQAIGGPSKALSPYMEAQFKLPYETPKAYAYANALGAALSRKTETISVIANTRRKTLSIPERSIDAEITASYTLNDAIETAKRMLEESDIDLIEAQSFNMVSYGSRADKNIRVVAQIRPGLIYDLKESY